MSNSSTVLGAVTSVLGASAVRLPGSEQYEKDNGSYFSAFENELKPSCIAQPSSPEKVQELIKVLSPQILAGDVQIAIRGAGHTPFAGSANIHDGVTVDIRGLKGIKLSEDKSTANIGAGETWTTVYAELEKHGLTVPGGRVGRVGISGFILGGGLSIFSTRTGFACDSVTEFEIVLPSGEIVCANADDHSDLWYALKGGLNNFGVVTRIQIQTIPSRDIWGGVTYYMPGAFSKLLQRACDFVHDETNEDTHIMCSAGYGFGHQAVACVMYHTQGKVNPPALQRFTSIEPQIKQMCTMRTSRHYEFTEELSRFSNNGQRQYWASITIKPDISLMEMFHTKWQETLATIKDAEGFIFSFGFHPLTKRLLENSEKAGGNPKAISPADGPLFVILINPVWTSQQDDERIFAAVGNLVGELRHLASRQGLLHRYIFTNYAFQHDEVIAGYGEESVSRLKQVSKKYDPEGLFRRGVPGGFKLPK